MNSRLKLWLKILTRTKSNLSSRDLNQNKPPDIETATPQSKAKDNVKEMNAAEFSKLLDDCITNFRSKQDSK